MMIKMFAIVRLVDDIFLSNRNLLRFSFDVFVRFECLFGLFC